MKMLLLIGVCGLLLAGCNDFLKKSEVKNFIPGTYTSEWKNEFSESRDTILIEVGTISGTQSYAITRRTYVRFYPGIKKHEAQYKLVHWMGSYNEEDRSIIIKNNGRVLSFDPASSEMKMGTTIYKKL